MPTVSIGILESEDKKLGVKYNVPLKPYNQVMPYNITAEEKAPYNTYFADDSAFCLFFISKAMYTYDSIDKNSTPKNILKK